MISAPDRFCNTLGSEFELCTKAIPHYAAYHKYIARQIKKSYLNGCETPISILDIGAGTGRLALELLDMGGINYDYVGIDHNELMHDLLVKRLPRNHLVYNEDALYFLQHNTRKYDVVVNAWTFHNWDKEYRFEVLKWVYNILVKNGLFINADKLASDTEQIHQSNLQWQITYMQKVFKSRPDIIKDWVEHYEDDEAPGVIMRESEYIHELQLLGFDPVKKMRRDKMEAILAATKK